MSYHKQEFINECAMGNIDNARNALELGLHKEKEFKFEEPSVYFNILNTRFKEIVYLVLEFGFDFDDLLNKATQNKSDLVLEALKPIILRNELEKNLPLKDENKKKLKI